jgi:RNA ligase (TIGR02306 family)
LHVSLRPFPEFLEKTDQPRLQAQINIIRELEPDRPFTATQKYDGQSVQWFYKDGRIGVCSRNFEVLLELDVDPDKRDKANDKFREMNDKYSIFDKLIEKKRNVSVQTELYGIGINGNRHKKNTVDIVVFDIYDIDKRRFLTHNEMVSFAAELGLRTVPVVFEDQPLLSENIEPWLKLANSQRYIGGFLAEGIVVRTSDGKDPYVSFKVISQEYLVKYDL